MRERVRIVALGAAFLTVALAASPFIDAAADRHLSAHMVQHVLLVSVAAPLFAAGHPFRRLGGLWSGPRLGAGLTITVAGVVQVGVLVGWHLPALYDAALENETSTASSTSRCSRLPSSSVVSWPLERGGRGRRRVRAVRRDTPGHGLGVAMTLARTPWYAAYAAEDPHALADQQLAGVVMWAYAGLAAFVGGCDHPGLARPARACAPGCHRRTRSSSAGLMLNRLLRWFDDRLGGTRFTRKALDKVFPDHWSFMLGEVALYCFVDPGGDRRVPHVLLPPERGRRRVQRLIRAAAWGAHVRGLPIDAAAELRRASRIVIRQIHHWAALLFFAAIVSIYAGLLHRRLRRPVE